MSAQDYRAATVEAIAEEVASMMHDDALFYALSRHGGPDWREDDHVYAAVRAAVYRRLGLVEVAEVEAALRDAHRHDSAADAVEYVADLVGWDADADAELQAEAEAPRAWDGTPLRPVGDGVWAVDLGDDDANPLTGER